ncbi:hypothetical protein FOA52_010209 [Chlamydomonas sp. UWO 241]|nr:hypothetical protein FOA52_010209 [Chlamydomonas sp. UWO 241]
MAAQEALVEALAGSIGAVIGVGITYPLTTISTWQALDHNTKNEEKSELGPGAAAKTGLQLPTPLRELRAYSRDKGWAALFGGVRPCLAATAVSQAAYFFLYSSLRHAVVARNTKRNTGGGTADAHTAAIGVAGSLLVAGLSGAGCVLLTNPAWVIATQMLSNAKSSDVETRQLTTTQVVVRVYEESGLAGFWKGLVPALVMVGNPTLQYIFYEWLTGRLLKLRRAAAAAGSRKALANVRLETSDVFMLTAMAKCGATTFTYPMLLVKSRLQAMNKRTDEGAQYAGVRNAVARILQAEGFGGFFKGMQLKMIQTVLSAALLMSIKERVYVGVRAALLAKPSL